MYIERRDNIRCSKRRFGGYYADMEVERQRERK